MRGDGMDTMALAIRVASWILVALPIAIGGWLGRRWLKNRVGLNIGMIVGSLVGVGLDLWFFHESISQPAPVLEIHAPADFAHESVILIEDPRTRTEVVWSRGHAQLDVPKSGVVRLKTLGVLDGHDIEARLNSQNYYGYGSMNFERTRLAMFNFAYHPQEPDIGLMSDEALLAYVHEREAEQ
jgi:hypothetical protein